MFVDLDLVSDVNDVIHITPQSLKLVVQLVSENNYKFTKVNKLGRLVQLTDILNSKGFC